MYYYDEEKLSRLAQIACDIAIKEGAEQVQASSGATRNTSVSVEGSSIKSTDFGAGSYLSIRAFFRGGVGTSTTDRLDEASVIETAKAAAQLAKLSEPDPDFVSLPGPAAYVPVEGLYDPKIAEMDVRQVVDACIRNIDGARSVTAEAIVSGGASVGFGSWALANSLGVRVSGMQSMVVIETMVVVRRGDDVGAFFDFDEARLLEDFAPDGLGESAARTALLFLGARNMETRVMPVILGPLAGTSIFDSIASAANAEEIQRNRSFLAGMKGKKIAPDIIRIIDDPLIPGGLSSRICDSEGFPSQQTAIVHGGVLETYLHNSYTSNKAHEPNTGHAGGATNLVPKLGDRTAAELIAEVDDGLYVNEGGIRPNMVTGDVSVAVDFGFKIEKGELAYPVQSTMIGGAFLDIVGNVDAISSDFRSEPGLIMPTVRIKSASVAGGG